LFYWDIPAQPLTVPPRRIRRIPNSQASSLDEALRG
jgi:hypothetical protein